MSSGAILQDIQIRCAALLDLNGHARLVLHNVFALHCNHLGVAEDRVGWACCHFHSKFILSLTSYMMMMMTWDIIFLRLCITSQPGKVRSVQMDLA